MTNIQIFLISLFSTFIFVRVFVLFAPNKTITGYVRHKTLLYFHHIYIGIVIMASVFPLILKNGLTAPLVSCFAVGLSLSLDELVAWLLFTEYPKKKEFILTLSFFILFSVYVYLR